MSAECVAENIPPGYKQTEVGVIPEDWNPVLMGSLGKFSKGQGIKKDEAASGEVPCIRYGEIYTHHNDIIKSFNSRISEEVTKSSKRLNKGDLLFAGSGETKEEIGKCVAFVGDEEAYAGGDIVILTPNKGRSKFFGYLFNSPIVAHQKASKGQGDAVVHISASALSSIMIPYPPTKEEQEAIAEALSDADALIESLEQLISKKRQIKQGAMQELLRPKDDWEPTSLGNIADANQRWSFTGGPFGSNLKSSEYTDDGVRIIQLQNIGDGKFKDGYEIYTSTQKGDELLSCNIYPGDIILSKMGDPVARACIIPPSQRRYLMSSDGIRLAVDQKQFNTYFVYTLINAPKFRMKAANASTGSTRKRIGLTELRNLELFCPSLPEQNAIAAILSDMDTEIATLEQKLAKSRELKQGMMQELLTGRIRLV
ncbi:restriction endonuclease subunit S [Methanococcoides sp. SA1]|nr:restriction endonuclease subunit S [Methanococcoides sp. SA1]